MTASKKIAYLKVTSFRGISIGARHWYGHLYGSGDAEFVEVQYRPTREKAEELNAIDGAGEVYDEWSWTGRFDSEQAVMDRAIQMCREQFPEAVLLLQCSPGVLDPRPYLFAPPEVSSRLHDIVQRWEKCGGWEGDREEATKLCAEWDAVIAEIVGEESKS